MTNGENVIVCGCGVTALRVEAKFCDGCGLSLISGVTSPSVPSKVATEPAKDAKVEEKTKSEEVKSAAQ